MRRFSLILMLLFGFAAHSLAYDLDNPLEWTNTAVLQTDTCGGASESATFPVMFSYDETQANLDWFGKLFEMYRVGDWYIGSLHHAEATYILYLQINSTTTYQAHLYTTFNWSPGCHWYFEWQGENV